MEKFLITGINSGLGKFLSQELSDGKGLHRDNFDEIASESYDVIVHCAFDKKKEINEIDGMIGCYRYLDDNIFLTQRLLDLNYSYFIYISSIDVHIRTTMYSTFKKFAESIVVRGKGKTIILRCPALIGKTMKSSHLTKIVCEKNSKLTLSGESTFNYILFEDILELLIQGKYRQMNGIYDLRADNNVKIKDIKKEFKSDVKLGDYIYKSPDVDEGTNTIYTGRTSMETIKEYFK
ncbi:MAG: hypothetical protein ACW98D_13740 [Promethearchaeota archaeon]|jgi:nucleoside-diphosphate-sugar epimerase